MTGAVAGSPSEVRETLTERIKRFIPYAVVTVSVREVAGNSVYVLGHVEKPGEYRASRQLDVLQALSLAGGVTFKPNEKGRRLDPYEYDRKKDYPFNYSEIKQILRLEGNNSVARRRYRERPARLPETNIPLRIVVSVGCDACCLE
jgi:polysaccharide export outer membrane protein